MTLLDYLINSIDNMTNIKREILKQATSHYIRQIIKLIIIITAKVMVIIPKKRCDIVFLADFKDNGLELANNLDNLDVKYIQFSLKSIIKSIYYIQCANIVLVDNVNIVVASLPNIKADVIQYWHATSAVKKFGLPTIDDEKIKRIRTKEFKHYDYIISNSTFMSSVFKDSMNFEDNQILELGSLQSANLFTNTFHIEDNEYIVYAPTFRWEQIDNYEQIHFLNDYDGDHKLYYSLHPKVEGEINNPKCIKVDNDIRTYFKNAKLVISDYSSLLVDASLLCDSVVMFGYDYDRYYFNTGLYIPQSKFWGYFTKDLEELATYINSNSYKTHSLEMLKEEYFTYDDHNSQDRIANYLKEQIKLKKHHK